jgi:protein transport protein SEC31
MKLMAGLGFTMAGKPPCSYRLHVLSVCACSVCVSHPPDVRMLLLTAPTGMAGAAPGAPGMPGAPAPVAARPAAAPPAPAGPPATVSVTNVDTSKVPAEQRAAVMSLTNLYNSCLPLATNPGQ